MIKKIDTHKQIMYINTFSKIHLHFFLGWTVLNPFIKEVNTDWFDLLLTLSCLQTAVVAHRAEEFKNKDGHSYNSQAHDEHHHPHCWTVRLCEEKQKRNKMINSIEDTWKCYKTVKCCNHPKQKHWSKHSLQ